MPSARWLICTACALLGLLTLGWPFSDAFAGKIRTLRVGMVPSLMHSQALVAMDLSDADQCWYKQRLPGTTIQWIPFSSGDKIISALGDNALDIAYINPGSILENIAKGNQNLRVLSGAMRGGAALVTRECSYLASAPDFKGKRLATPKFGSLQDIACRVWLMDAGLNIQITGGDVSITPVANPDQHALFVSGHVDGVWTQEPWVSRLEQVAGAQILYEDRSTLATVLVAGTNILQEDKIAVEAFAKAHADLTLWIQRNPEEAQRRIASQLTRMDRRTFPLKLIENAWHRLSFDNLVCLYDFKDILKKARRAGFIKEHIPLEKFLMVISMSDCSFFPGSAKH